MPRSRFVAVGCAVLVALAGVVPVPAGAVSPAPASSPRAHQAMKGVAGWDFRGGATALARSHARWFYTWSTSPGALHAPRASFVPMVWGSGSVTPAALAQAERESHILLTFNEPDQGGQANMTPAQALSYWPRLERTGMTLGSPAVSSGAATPGGWLDRFMAGARARHYRIDFIALHWYGGDFRTPQAVAELKSYLEAVHVRYRKPVWLTEYSLIRFGASSAYPGGATQARFVRASIHMLDTLPWVQRYAWFALPTFDGGGTGLYRPGARPTAAGRAFAATS